MASTRPAKLPPRRPRGRDYDKPACRWDDSFYLKSYELARTGMADAAIAEALGASAAQLGKWVRTRPALKDALKKGRAHAAGRAGHGGETFIDYVYKRLPDPLKEAGRMIVDFDELGESGEAKLDRMLAGMGVRMRQHLFVHALVCSNFKVNEACRRAGVALWQFQKWKDEDADFAALMLHVLQMRKEFCVGSLMDLVAAKDGPSVRFALMCLWPEEFNPKLRTEHNYAGEVTHRLHAQVEVALPPGVEFDDMPAELAAGLLEYARAKNGRALPPKEVNGEVRGEAS